MRAETEISKRLAVADFAAHWLESPFAAHEALPWQLTGAAADLIFAAVKEVGDDYRVADRIAVHRSATVEEGAVLKAPILVGPGCFLGAGAYLRGGVYLARGCCVGPACEVKSSFLMPGARIAHLSFVGDSILGSEVNVEAGAVIANHRNEAAEKAIRILFEGTVIETGVEKFGALVGDGVRIGANAVIAPGALLRPATIIQRLSLVDQSPD